MSNDFVVKILNISAKQKSDLRQAQCQNCPTLSLFPSANNQDHLSDSIMVSLNNPTVVGKGELFTLLEYIRQAMENAKITFLVGKESDLP